ncbi:thioredoxin family protein [Thiolapillus sp.]
MLPSLLVLVSSYVINRLKILFLLVILVASASVRAATDHADGIRWYPGTVKQAFAEAKKSGKPVFLYWGAVWCPPCNQLKATLFRNPAFIRKTRLFVPVYLDGDTEAAQKLGEQLGVLGYPTLMLFSPGGEEITRLPGGMNLDLYPRMLDLALAQTRPVATLIREILDNGRKPSAEEWRMLAYYSWEQDGGKALGERDLAAVLKTLSDKVPASLSKEKARLSAQYLSALAAREQPPGKEETRDAVKRLQQLLASGELSRDNFSFVVHELDVLIPRISRAGSQDREKLMSAWQQALNDLQKDATLSPAQKLSVYAGKIHWLKTAGKKLPESLKEEIRQAVDQARSKLNDGHERIAVNYAAYNVLKASGQLALAEQLINQEMAAGSNNQYWMLVLADLAAESGDEAEALNWYARAWDTATGAATKIQWGSYYIRQLTEQAPDEDAKIIQVSKELFSQLEKQKAPFHGRSKRALERVFKALNVWGQVSSPAELIEIKRAFINTCLPFGKEAMERCESIMKAS